MSEAPARGAAIIPPFYFGLFYPSRQTPGCGPPQIIHQGPQEEGQQEMSVFDEQLKGLSPEEQSILVEVSQAL